MSMKIELKFPEQKARLTTGDLFYGECFCRADDRNPIYMKVKDPYHKPAYIRLEDGLLFNVWNPEDEVLRVNVAARAYLEGVIV